MAHNDDNPRSKLNHTDNSFSDEILKLAQCLMPEPPTAKVKRMVAGIVADKGIDRQLHEMGWKAYDTVIGAANNVTNSAFTSPAVGQVLGGAIDIMLRWQRLNAAVAGAFFSALWPAVGLPSATELEAVRRDVRAMREELRDAVADRESKDDFASELHVAIRESIVNQQSGKNPRRAKRTATRTSQIQRTQRSRASTNSRSGRDGPARILWSWVKMSAINEIASLWMEGTMRTLDAFRTGFGATMDDPPPATRSRIIYESGLVRLRHYEARGDNKKRVPLLLIYSLIKRPFILDLQPGRSVVEYLVKQGFDVFLIDWIPPRADDRNHGFDDYVNTDIANAVRAIQIYTGIEQISILGYCFGALLGLMYTAMNSGNVKNLVTLTIPLDTSPRQLPIEHLTAAMTSRSAQMIVDTYGNAPAWMIYSFFNTLAPTHHLLDKFVGAYRSSGRPGYIDTFRLFERWLHSDVAMAGRIFLETSEMWRENSLMKGTMKIGGSVADLTRVACPLLNVIGDKDDIVNPMSSEPLPELVSSDDKQNLHYPTGHMGAAISADSLKRLWPQIANWLSVRDE